VSPLKCAANASPRSKELLVRSRTTVGLMALSAAFVTALSAGTAFAEVRVRDRDASRLRYGVALEGGGLVAPGVVDLGFAGIQGQLGVQLDHLIGVYAAPHIDMVSGARALGIQVGSALLIDFTLAHVFTVGVGPDIAGFVALGGGEAAGGLLYGARLHLAVNPLVSIAADGIRRRALTIGLDLRLATGGSAGVLSTRRAGVGELVAAPMLTIGYQAF
jgi:hypothetical protein